MSEPHPSATPCRIQQRGTHPTCRKLDASLSLHALKSSLHTPVPAQTVSSGSGHFDSGESEGEDDEPHITAFVEVLSLACSWIQQLSDEAAPHQARVAIISQVHEEAQAQASRIGEAFIAKVDLAAAVSGNMGAEAQAGTQAGDGTFVDSPVRSSSQSGSAGDHHATHLRRLNTTLDQAAFVLQTAERYLRFVSVAMAAGKLDTPSTLRGALPATCEKLMGQVVTAEGWLVTAQVRRALDRSHPTFVQSGVPIDSWLDEAFFVLHKAISRAASTHSAMTAAATLNHAAGCVAHEVLAALRIMRKACCIPTGAAPPDQYFGDPGSRNTWWEDPEAEAELASAAGAGASPKTWPTVSPLALRTMNSMFCAGDFISRLRESATVELQQVFPSAPGSSSSSPETTLLPIFLHGSQELDGVQQEHERLVSCLPEEFVNAAFGGGLRAWTDLLPMATLVIPSEQYDLVLHQHSLFHAFKGKVLDAGCTGFICDQLHPSAKQAVIQELAEQAAGALEAASLAWHCNELGGLYLQSLIRDMRSALAAASGLAALHKPFARVHQMASILSVSSVDEVHTVYLAQPLLTSDDIKALLHHRTDFYAGDVSALQLDGLNLAQ